MKKTTFFGLLAISMTASFANAAAISLSSPLLTATNPVITVTDGGIDFGVSYAGGNYINVQEFGSVTLGADNQGQAFTFQYDWSIPANSPLLNLNTEDHVSGHAAHGAISLYLAAEGLQGGYTTLTQTGANSGTAIFTGITGTDDLVIQPLIIMGNLANLKAAQTAGDNAAGTAITISNISLQVASVPEPGTFALCGLGLLGFVTRRRR